MIISTYMTLWIIEDEEAIRTLLAEFASVLGMRVRTFSTLEAVAEATLDLLGASGSGSQDPLTPDVVLTDYFLNSKTSRAWIHQAKRLMPSTRFILFSGSLDTDVLHEFRAAGVDCYPKPDRLGDILDLLRKMSRLG